MSKFLLPYMTPPPSPISPELSISSSERTTTLNKIIINFAVAGHLVWPIIVNFLGMRVYYSFCMGLHQGCTTVVNTKKGALAWILVFNMVMECKGLRCISVMPVPVLTNEIVGKDEVNIGQ